MKLESWIKFDNVKNFLSSSTNTGADLICDWLLAYKCPTLPTHHFPYLEEERGKTNPLLIPIKWALPLFYTWRSVYLSQGVPLSLWKQIYNVFWVSAGGFSKIWDWTWDLIFNHRKSGLKQRDISHQWLCEITVCHLDYVPWQSVFMCQKC